MEVCPMCARAASGEVLWEGREPRCFRRVVKKSIGAYAPPTTPRYTPRMPSDTSFVLNGRRVELGRTDPTQTLLRWLQRHGSHGTKEGCGDGDCGACTVALVETDAHGRAHYRAVNSCLLPVGLLPGREITTVEALAEGDRLHPVQQALVDHAGGADERGDH